MSLKLATMDDLNTVYNMALRFAEKSGYEGLMDPEKIHSIVKDFLSSPKEEKIIILHGLDGMIAGMKVPFTFGTTYIASEVAWWVEPKARTKLIGSDLLRAFEAWGKKVGCNFVAMSCLDDKVAKFYEKNFYKLKERAYLKEL